MGRKNGDEHTQGDIITGPRETIHGILEKDRAALRAYSYMLVLVRCTTYPEPIQQVLSYLAGTSTRTGMLSVGCIISSKSEILKIEL